MAQYIIIDEGKWGREEYEDFIKRFKGTVNAKMAEGYMPVGGITNRSEYHFLQPMMKNPSLSGGKGSKRRRIRKNVSSRRR